MWACSLQVHAVRFTIYRLKYWLLIGGIRLMRNFVVACATRQTGWDARSISIYGNASLSFLERVLSIVTIFISSLPKIITLLKMIPRYHSVPDWAWHFPSACHCGSQGKWRLSNSLSYLGRWCWKVGILCSELFKFVDGSNCEILFLHKQSIKKKISMARFPVQLMGWLPNNLRFCPHKLWYCPNRF